MTVGVTATPVEVRWTSDDDEWTCPGPGAPYSEDRYRDALDAGGFVDDGDLCTYLLTDANRHLGGPMPVSVRVVWGYSWSLNGVDQGVFGPGVLSPPTDFDLDIREIQAVGTD